MKKIICSICRQDIDVDTGFSFDSACSDENCGCMGILVNPHICDSCENDLFGVRKEEADNTELKSA